MTEFRSLCRLPGRLSGLARLAAIPALTLGLALSGCAGEPDPLKTEALVKSRLEAEALQQMRTQISEYQTILATLRQTTMCVSSAEKKPEFKRLQAHGADEGDGKTPPSPAKLTDAGKASAKDGKMIAAFLEAMAPCRPAFGAIANPANRNIARVISDTWTDQQELYGRLKDRKISWGAFNQGTRSNSDKLSGALKALRLTNEG